MSVHFIYKSKYIKLKAEELIIYCLNFNKILF